MVCGVLSRGAWWSHVQPAVLRSIVATADAAAYLREGCRGLTVGMWLARLGLPNVIAQLQNQYVSDLAG